MIVRSAVTTFPESLVVTSTWTRDAGGFTITVTDEYLPNRNSVPSGVPTALSTVKGKSKSNGMRSGREGEPAVALSVERLGKYQPVARELLG